jgi:hypothetical protein
MKIKLKGQVLLENCPNTICKEKFQSKKESESFFVNESDQEVLHELFENEEKYFQKSSNLSSIFKRRTRVVDWIIEFSYAYELSSQTTLLAITYFDAVFQSLNLHEKDKQIQLIAACSLWIASKYHEGESEYQTVKHLSVDACYFACTKKFKREEFAFCEKIILKILRFSLTRVTPLEFLEFIQRHIKLSEEQFNRCIVNT